MIHFAYVFPQPLFGSETLAAAATLVEQRLDIRLPSWRAQMEQRRGIPSATRFRPPTPRRSPVPAPRSIAVNLFEFLASNQPTAAYDWRERTSCHYGSQDLILGHPNYDERSIMQRTLRDPRPSRVKALIFPIHHGLPHYVLPFASLVERADVVFGLMGSYWYDTLAQSPLASWTPKIVRLDMAIAADHYPFLRSGFNPPGKRGYLYIGRNSAEKGTDILRQTFAALGRCCAGWIGPGPEIPGIPRIARRMNFTPATVRRLAERYDFFVNTSVSDANPTTILEAMAWGFPVACTPQSGYYKMPSILTLDVHNIDRNVRVLKELQYAEESWLLDLSHTNRQLVESHYTWDRFCSTVWSRLQA